MQAPKTVATTLPPPPDVLYFPPSSYLLPFPALGNPLYGYAIAFIAGRCGQQGNGSGQRLPSFQSLVKKTVLFTLQRASKVHFRNS